ncbi:MAG: DUF4367 domain-containing protein [Agathobacter sp.]|nr:DUF4367 domain-containing protein [Agathobacter sp.]
MSMTREEFKRAFTEVASMEFADIPTDESEIDFTFSQKFLRKMDNLIALQQDGVWRFLNMMRRHIAVIAIIILGVTVSACGINQVITHLYDNVYEEMREEFYAGVTATEISYIYEISKVPEGFALKRLSKAEGSVITEYQNTAGDEIIFLQDATDEVKMNIKQTGWDDPMREQVTRTSMTVRGIEVELYENKYVTGAIWIENGYCMEIQYYGCEGTDEVIALVEVVK